MPTFFSAGPFAHEEAACVATAERVLWYLQCPGFEDSYSPDQRATSAAAQQMPPPPIEWLQEGAASEALEAASRKTTVMRLQNRLQQTFAQHTAQGRSVWEWQFDTTTDEAEGQFTFRATVRVPALGGVFVGGWAPTRRDAQVDACERLATFLDEAELRGRH